METRKLLKHISSSFMDDDKLHSVYSTAVTAGAQAQARSPALGMEKYLKHLNSSFSGTVAQSPHTSPLPTKRRFRRAGTGAGVGVGEQRHPKKKDGHNTFVSFVVVYTMIFFNGCCFTAVVPSVPFYLEVLSAPPSFLGWVVSFYSVGQIIGSPAGGFLADKVSSKLLLTISSTIGFFSSALYSLAPVYMLILVARLLTGISAGMEFATELAFISKNTSKKERTVYLASVTAVNVVGFILGPALAGLISTLHTTIFGIVTVDKYTGPGWLLAVMFMVDILMVQLFFEDKQQDDSTNNTGTVNEKKSSEKSTLLQNGKDGKHISYGAHMDPNKNEGVDELDPEAVVMTLRDSQRPPSLPLVLGLIFVQFTVMVSWSVLETITSPLAADNFGWDVQNCNLLFTAGGAVSLAGYIGFVVASNWVADRWLIAYALVVCIVGQMLAINWGELEWVPRGALALDFFSTTYRDRFIIGYLVMNVGFMTARPVTFALYSKLIGPAYQGKYLGFMVAGGSAARTLGPFGAVALYYQIKSPGVNLLALFGAAGILHLLCLLLVVLLWGRLLPPPSSGLSVRDAVELDVCEKPKSNHSVKNSWIRGSSSDR